MNNKLDRRSFCYGILSNGAALLGVGAIVTACGGEKSTSNQTAEKPVEQAQAPAALSGDPCTDFSTVEPSELEKRKALGYVEKSPIPENTCENCKLFIPGQADTDCGGCQLFKGPVFLDAYCTYWADATV